MKASELNPHQGHSDTSASADREIKEKDKDKDLVEVSDPFRQVIDPEIINATVKQLVALEMQAHKTRSPFIKPFMRPHVGEAIMKRGKKR